MNHRAEPLPLSTAAHSHLPVLSMPAPPRPPEYEYGAHDVDLKGYFNIL